MMEKPEPVKEEEVEFDLSKVDIRRCQLMMKCENGEPNALALRAAPFLDNDDDDGPGHSNGLYTEVNFFNTE